MKAKLHIVKVGGKLMEDPKELEPFLHDFTALDGLKILVHGGGRTASVYEEKMGLSPKLTGGRRITDAASLDVIVMVYGGLINKSLVARLQAMKCNAIGLSGADGDIIRSRKRPVGTLDYGFAGDITQVNGRQIETLLRSGLIPVFCPLTHDGKGQLLNTNADTIASQIACSLSDFFDTGLYYCFDRPGVLADGEHDESLLQSLSRQEYRELEAAGRISSGMLPKLHNAFTALENGVNRVKIGGRKMIAKNDIPYTNLVL